MTGAIYRFGFGGVKIDEEKAIHYFTLSAEKGVLNSFFFLFEMLTEKRIIEEKIPKLVSLYHFFSICHQS